MQYTVPELAGERIKGTKRWGIEMGLHNRLGWIKNLMLAGIFAVTALSPAQGKAWSGSFSVSPDHSLEHLLFAVRSAQHELLINIYQFDNVMVAQEVEKLIQRGVSVKILLEGEPVEGISPSSRQIMQRLLDDMKGMIARGQPDSNFGFYIMVKPPNGTRRFVYDHAKYMVIDGARLWISSENFGYGAFPVAGYVGNRGWHAFVEQPALAAQFKSIFTNDVSLAAGDIVDAIHLGIPQLRPATDKPVNKNIRSVPTFPIVNADVNSFKVITSPNSISGLTSLISSSTREVNLEYMSLPQSWKDPVTTQYIESPLITALVAAARRGVVARVLLNDQNAFATPPTPQTPTSTGPAHFLSAFFGPGDSQPPTVQKDLNRETICYLNSMARLYGVHLEGRTVGIKTNQISYIHNKGITVDGARTLVSSINGTQNSIMKNRETAIVMDSLGATNYFNQVFAQDWNNSAVTTAAECQKLAP